MKIRYPKNEKKDIRGDPFVECQLTGFKARLSETVIQWDGRRVLRDWADRMPEDLLPKPKYPNELKSLGDGLVESANTFVANLPSATYSDPWKTRLDEES